MFLVPIDRWKSKLKQLVSENKARETQLIKKQPEKFVDWDLEFNFSPLPYHSLLEGRAFRYTKDLEFVPPKERLALPILRHHQILNQPLLYCFAQACVRKKKIMSTTQYLMQLIRAGLRELAETKSELQSKTREIHVLVKLVKEHERAATLAMEDTKAKEEEIQTLKKQVQEYKQTLLTALDEPEAEAETEKVTTQEPEPESEPVKEIIWSVITDVGMMDYSPEVSKQIEESESPQVSIILNTYRYTIHVKDMKQVNDMTGTSRPISRREGVRKPDSSKLYGQALDKTIQSWVRNVSRLPKQKCRRLELDPEQTEYKYIEKLFLDTPESESSKVTMRSQYDAKIIKIERIIHPLAAQGYQLQLDSVENKTQYLLWHGNRNGQHNTIIEKGIDPRRGHYTGLLGSGAYFAASPIYSHGYTTLPSGSNNQYQMVAACVHLGQCYDTYNAGRAGSYAPDGYDSVSAVSTSPSGPTEGRVYAVYDRYQSYVAYSISYTVTDPASQPAPQVATRIPYYQPIRTSNNWSNYIYGTRSPYYYSRVAANTTFTMPTTYPPDDDLE